MTRGGNRRCKICLEMSLEDRADIDKRLIDGEKYRTITEDYPEISRYTLQYHRTHMGNPQSEADVMAIRLSREQALARMNAYNPVEFINLLRERLEGVISESQTIVEEFAHAVHAMFTWKKAKILWKSYQTKKKTSLTGLLTQGSIPG